MPSVVVSHVTITAECLVWLCRTVTITAECLVWLCRTGFVLIQLHWRQKSDFAERTVQHWTLVRRQLAEVYMCVCVCVCVCVRACAVCQTKGEAVRGPHEC